MSNYVKKKRMRILDYLRKCHEETGVYPTIREICQYMGYKSTNTAAYHLARLEEEGLLGRSEHQARAYTIKGHSRTDGVGIPLIGRVAAGEPILAAENFEEYVDIDSMFSVSRGGTYALRVQGTSMIEAGIYEGDLVIIRASSQVDRGEIAVVVIDEEATVKCVYDEGTHWRFQPRNAAMDPIIVSKKKRNVRIAGKVIGVIRQL